MFKDQIGKTIEVYMDDMLVKSQMVVGRVRHFGEAFTIVRQYKMKINPKKCIFKVTSGKFSATWSIIEELMLIHLRSASNKKVPSQV